MSTKNSSIPTKKYKKIIDAVHMVYRLVNSTYNVKELTLRLTRLLCQFIRADYASVFILDPQKKRLQMIAQFDNEINIFLSKKTELSKVSAKELEVTKGFPIIEKHLIGLPLVSDDNIGAIFIQRKPTERPFNDFDKDMLSVVAEQSVTAIRYLQSYEEQQNVILSSIEFIGKLLKRYGPMSSSQTPEFFKILKAVCEKLNVKEDEIERLYYASILHDAGAIDVPYNILSKSSQLTSEEFKEIRTLPKKSADLIRPVEFLKPVLPIILYHHERYDGTGYPSGLKKEQIPLSARILSVVNAFCAMTRERLYKKRFSVQEALHELEANSGTQFDPKVVNAFLTLAKQKNFRKLLSSKT
ncbi:MAG: HD domain-containing protein [Candidatus Omnitrophica bacterium]|nr:HD domain-containing protein [Candidatus Omnitrophota bacterium]